MKWKTSIESELYKLAQEVSEVVRETAGRDQYLEAYAGLQKNRSIKMESRIRKRALAVWNHYLKFEREFISLSKNNRMTNPVYSQSKTQLKILSPVLFTFFSVLQKMLWSVITFFNPFMHNVEKWPGIL